MKQEVQVEGGAPPTHRIHKNRIRIMMVAQNQSIKGFQFILVPSFEFALSHPTMSLSSLPVDILPVIFQYIPLPSLHTTLPLVNTYFCNFILENESFQREYAMRTFVRYREYEGNDLPEKLCLRAIWEEKSQLGRILGLFWSARKGFIYDLHKSIENIAQFNKAHGIEWHLEAETMLGGMNLLHEACHYGQLGVVRYLVEERCMSLDTTRLDGSTCLLIATRHAHVLEYVMNKLPSTQHLLCTNTAGDTALSLAAHRGSEDVVKMLLQRIRSEPNIVSFLNTGSNAQNPLHKAVLHSHTNVFRYLLQNAPEIDVNQRDVFGVSPIESACRVHAADIVAPLLHHDRIRFSSEILAKECIKDDSAPILQLLLGHAFQPSVEYLFYCIQYNALSCLTLLLQHHAHLLNLLHPKYQMTPLVFACVLRRTHIVDLLLLMDADESIAETKYNRDVRQLSKWLQISPSLNPTFATLTDQHVKKELNLHFALPHRFPTMRVGARKRVVLLGGDTENRIDSYCRALATELGLETLNIKMTQITSAIEFSEMLSDLSNTPRQMIVFCEYAQYIDQSKFHHAVVITNRFFQFVDKVKHKDLDHYLVVLFPSQHEESSIVSRMLRERLEKREYPVLYVRNPDHDARCVLLREQGIPEDECGEISKSLEDFTVESAQRVAHYLIASDSQPVDSLLEEAKYFVQFSKFRN